MGELLLIANAGDGSISACRLHREPETRLEVLATTGGLPGCGTFAVDAGRDLVHAAYKGDAPGIATLRLDRVTGELSECSRRAVESSMTYLSLTRGGTTLLGASYGGGFGAAWPVEGEALGEPHSRFAHRNLHCIVPNAAGDRAYAVSLGEDLVAQFEIDGEGRLSPLDPPTVAAPVGSGPRHLIVEGANAYLVTEYSGELIRFSVDAAGRLSAAESRDVVDPRAGLRHSRFGADPRVESLIWGADVHRAGSYLVTSERSSSQLTSVALDAHGHLRAVLGYTPTEPQPRGFVTTADGAFLVAVGERSTHATLYRTVPNGALEQCDRVPIGRGANWVRVVEAAPMR